MGARISGWFGGYRTALAGRDIRLLFGALTISATGSWAYNVGLLAFIFARTHSLGWVAAAGVARLVPQLLLSVYAGVLAERRERIALLRASDLLCAVWQGGLCLVAAAGGPPALALALVVLTSASSVVYAPATTATIPSLVDEDRLAAANALNGTIEQLVVIAGPGIGAAMLLVGSPAAVFAVNAASFLISALIVSRIRTRSRPVDVTEGGAAGPLRQMAVGIREIAALPAALTMVLFSVLVSFVYGTDTVLFVDVSARQLGTGANGFGYLLAGLGVGGVLAAGAVDRLSSSRRLAWIILLGALGYTLPTALLVAVHSAGLAFLLEVLRGAATLVVDVLAVTALQRAVAPDRLARVFGVFWALVVGAIALGSLLAAPVVSAAGLHGGLVILAAAPALIAVLGYPALRSADAATAAQAARLEPRVALLEAVGIFAASSRPVLERLAAVASEARFPAGSRIVVEGEAAEALFVLAAGEVRVTLAGEAGSPERELRVMRSPSVFGEIGVLERIPRTATVTAISDCECLEVQADALLDALASSPASPAFIEGAHSRLATSHPGRPVRHPVAAPAATAGRAGTASGA